MGVASSVRVQVGASSITLAATASTRNTMLHRGADKDLKGDQGAVGQRGNKGGNTFSRKLCFSILLVKKKERGDRNG